MDNRPKFFKSNCGILGVCHCIINIFSYSRYVRDIDMISCMLDQYQDFVHDLVLLYRILCVTAVAYLGVLQQWLS